MISIYHLSSTSPAEVRKLDLLGVIVVYEFRIGTDDGYPRLRVLRPAVERALSDRPTLAASANLYAIREEGGTRRIVGGKEATGDYQWVTLVQKIGGSSITCAGELIADTWMVTAAHCLLNSYNTGYRVVGPGNTEIIYGCIDLTSSACKKARHCPALRFSDGAGLLHVLSYSNCHLRE